MGCKVAGVVLQVRAGGGTAAVACRSALGSGILDLGEDGARR